jgi:glycosyltransferase involved in cell wall biosynthesis
MAINVLHISISDALGGAAIASQRLHSIFSKERSLNSKMLVLVKNTSDQTTVELTFIRRQIARFGNLFNNWLGSFKKIDGLFSFALIGNELHQRQIVRDADVIYIHWVNNGMMSWRAIEKLFLLKKPIFLFGHDMWYFTGGCHQSNGCALYKNGCGDCPVFNNSLHKNLVKSNFKDKKIAYESNANVKHILPSSDFFRKTLCSSIIDSSKVIFIPNILDTYKFVPAPVFEKSDTIKILYGAMGGKTNPYKGWDDFIYFAGQVTEKYKSSVEIHLFGYDFLSDELESLPFKAVSHGMIDEECQIIKMYQKMDVFVFPSNQESFGQTLIEAMSCGVIPIAYNVGIAPDAIVSGQNGFLVEIGDRINLVNAFEMLVSVNINQMKNNVRASIERNFSKEVIIKKHLKLIQSSL